MLKLGSQTWDALYLGAIDLKEALTSGKVELATDDRQGALDAFAMFDRFVETRTYKIPPLED